jgi:hypothetical protein
MGGAWRYYEISAAIWTAFRALIRGVGAVSRWTISQVRWWRRHGAVIAVAILAMFAMFYAAVARRHGTWSGWYVTSFCLAWVAVNLISVLAEGVRGRVSKFLGI